MPDDSQGILTETQRTYLRDESTIEPDSSHERAIRSRIRNRLYNSIFDLALLQATLEPRDVKQAFEDDNGPVANHIASLQKEPATSVEEWQHIFNQIGSVLALIFDGTARASRYRDFQIGDEDDDTDEIIEMFTSLVEEGVTKMFLQRGVTVKDVTVQIGVELGPQIADVSTNDLSTLSETQLKQLLETETIGPEEYGLEIKRRQGT